MTEAEWAYLAGLIDGEGSISISHTVVVRIANTDFGILKWMWETFPEAKVNIANSNTSYGKKLCLAIRWNGVKAKPILEHTLPYLQGKKHKLAELGLEMISYLETNYRYMSPEIANAKGVLKEAAAILNSQ